MSEVICICKCGHSADVHDWADSEEGWGCLESISHRRACPCIADRESVYEAALAAKDDEIKRLVQLAAISEVKWMDVAGEMQDRAIWAETEVVKLTADTKLIESVRDADVTALTARNAELAALLRKWLDYNDGFLNPMAVSIDDTVSNATRAALEAKP